MILFESGQNRRIPGRPPIISDRNSWDNGTSGWIFGSDPIPVRLFISSKCHVYARTSGFGSSRPRIDRRSAWRALARNGWLTGSRSGEFLGGDSRVPTSADTAASSAVRAARRNVGVAGGCSATTRPGEPASRPELYRQLSTSCYCIVDIVEVFAGNIDKCRSDVARRLHVRPLDRTYTH